MVLHFNVTKDKRKAMVRAIEKEIGGKAKYLGVPSCAYEIGSFTVGKNIYLILSGSEETSLWMGCDGLQW